MRLGLPRRRPRAHLLAEALHLAKHVELLGGAVLWADAIPAGGWKRGRWGGWANVGPWWVEGACAGEPRAQGALRRGPATQTLTPGRLGFRAGGGRAAAGKVGRAGTHAPARALARRHRPRTSGSTSCPQSPSGPPRSPAPAQHGPRRRWGVRGAAILRMRGGLPEGGLARDGGRPAGRQAAGTHLARPPPARPAGHPPGRARSWAVCGRRSCAGPWLGVGLEKCKPPPAAPAPRQGRPRPPSAGIRSPGSSLWLGAGAQAAGWSMSRRGVCPLLPRAACARLRDCGWPQRGPVALNLAAANRGEQKGRSPPTDTAALWDVGVRSGPRSASRSRLRGSV